MFIRFSNRSVFYKMNLWRAFVSCSVVIVAILPGGESALINYDDQTECANFEAASSGEDRNLLRKIRKDYTPHKHTWENITDVVKRQLNHNKRNIAATFAYQKHKQAVLLGWATQEDFIKHHALQCSYVTKVLRGRVVKYIDNMTSCKSFSVVENMFPYTMTDDITNYVIWSVTWLGVFRIKKLIDTLYPSDRYDIAIFATPDRDKTISLVHVHFLVRPRRTGDYLVFVKETT